ncbi:HlyD family secretion protein [Kalamiella sp. sgz302252]|uniref:HlyD family secretion protein n=1 Tax=Pantoea sp. sgz302252 TaxID=3341827 RepID=UPI0036D24196
MKRLFNSLVAGKNSKAGKYLLAAILVLALLWLCTRKTTSKEAFINASVTQIASPIPGTLAWRAGIYPGAMVKESQLLGAVNWNASNAQLTQLLALRQTTQFTLAGLQQQLSGNRLKIAARKAQWQQYYQESQRQQRLQRDYSRAGYQQAEAEEKAAVQQARFASNQLRRADELHRQGYLSDAGYERQRSEAEALRAQAQAKRAASSQSLLDSQAASDGLQLSGARTLTGPEQNQREMQLSLDDLQQAQQTLTVQLDAARQNLAQIDQQLARQQHADIRATLDGAIWSVNARQGSSVESNGSLIEIIDCRNSWVEAFFDESAAGQLRPGKQVNVALSPADSRYGEWQGVIEAVRAGTGRVAVGDSVVIPPPEIARRQLPVKVVTARIRIQRQGAMQAAGFCLAGRSVTVSL